MKFLKNLRIDLINHSGMCIYYNYDLIYYNVHKLTLYTMMCINCII